MRKIYASFSLVFSLKWYWHFFIVHYRIHVDEGQLRQINPEDGTITDKPYEFQVSDDASHNQARYEALGEVITEHVYEMLIDAGLHKIYIPSPETDTSSFVFGTKTDFKDTKKLLFLIHGSGVVRAGQWARSLIINQSVNHGTQIPYIKRAIELGYDVLVTNTNHRYRIKDGERVYLDGHETPEQHINSVWEQLIEPALDTIDSFAIVAHSYGGVVTLNMAKNYPHAFVNKCFAIAFTDSVHYAGKLFYFCQCIWFNEILVILLMDCNIFVYYLQDHCLVKCWNGSEW